MVDGKDMKYPDKIHLRFACLVSTMGPIGCIPRGPGTAAAFTILIPAFALAAHHRYSQLAILTCIIMLVGQWASVRAERVWGHDPSRVVIDEAAGQLVAVLYLPADWTLFAGAFILFRIFDILKPWPVSWIDRRAYSWSVMGDDIAAGLMSRFLLFCVQMVRFQ